MESQGWAIGQGPASPVLITTKDTSALNFSSICNEICGSLQKTLVWSSEVVRRLDSACDSSRSHQALRGLRSTTGMTHTHYQALNQECS